MAYLEWSRGGRRGRFDLTEKMIVIGRSEKSSLVLGDPAVSRQHATVEGQDGEFFITDRKSRYGTLVNGRRIERRTRLRDGDRVTIGGTVLEFHGRGSGRDGETSPLFGGGGNLETRVMSTRAAEVDRDWGTGLEAEAKLRAIMEVMRSFDGSIEIGELLERVLESLFRIFSQAKHGVILLRDERGELRPAAVRDRTPGAVPLAVSRTVIQEALEKRQAFLSSDAASDALLRASESISEFSIHSVMCVPLVHPSDEPLGVLQIHADDPSRPFREEDLDLLVGLASAVAMALENLRLHENLAERKRMERELELARDVQRRFLPAAPPEVAGYRFHAAYAAAWSVGGDCYGFTELPDGRWAISVGDVSGKGMSAAMLMARLSSDIRYATITAPEPARALAMLHRSLVETEIEERFVTLLLMVLDPERGVLTLANAGHPPPFIGMPEGGVRRVADGVAGLPLNVSLERDYSYRSVELELPPGGFLFAYTDGIVEATNARGEMFGEGRLESVLLRGNRNPREIVDDVMSETSRFAAGVPQHDDMTVVCLDRSSGPATSVRQS